MVSIILYSEDINHIIKWEKDLKDFDTTLLLEEEELRSLKNSLLVIAYSALRHDLGIIEKLAASGNKVLILDNHPTLRKGQKIIQRGALGYGNVMMAKVYLLSAIETLKSGSTWIMPLLIKELIQSLPPQNPDQKEEIIRDLTIKEREIAKLICESCTNKEIADRQAVTINTVKSHIKHIYAKCHVKDKLSFVKLFQ